MRAKFVMLALCSTVITVGVMPNLVRAQIPSLHQLQSPSQGIKDFENRIVSDWVYLDGRRLFRVAAPKSKLGERLQSIHNKLADISQDYFEKSSDHYKRYSEASGRVGFVEETWARDAAKGA